MSKKGKKAKAEKQPEAEEVKQPKDVACYWQDDSNPTPVIRVEKMATKTEAEAWLKEQKSSQHWIPKIGKISSSAK